MSAPRVGPRNPPCRDGRARHPFEQLVVLLRHEARVFRGGRYRIIPAKESTIACLRCKQHWRTSASYVEEIPRTVNPKERR